MNRKTVFRSIACALAVLTTLGCGSIIPTANVFPDVSITANAATVTSKGYIFEKVDGGIKFLGFSEEDDNGDSINPYPTGTELVIPSQISGYTVVAIGELEISNAYRDYYKSVVIPASVKRIEDNAFYNWGELSKVTFKGKAITYIGEYAFSDTNIKEFSIETSGDLVIDEYAFNASALNKLTIKNSGKLTLKPNAFYKCYNLTTVSFNGTGAIVVGQEAFYDLGSLETVTFPATSTSAVTIGKQAFYNCSELKKVTLSKGTTAIGSEAFYNCSSLETVNLSNLTSLKQFEDGVFEKTALADITIPASITYIKDSAFANIENYDSDYDTLKPSTLTFADYSKEIRIDADAFNGTTFKTVTIPSSSYNSTKGTIYATTFGNYENLIVKGIKQKVRGINDVEGLKTLKAPYASYVWACVQQGMYDTEVATQPSYLTFTVSDLEEVYTNKSGNSNIKFTVTRVSLKEVNASTSDGVNVKYATSITKSEVNNGTGAKDLVVTVKYGVSKFIFTTPAQIKSLFTYSDKVNGVSGSFTIGTKTDSSGQPNGYVKLASDITKTYTVQAGDFDTAKVSLDTVTDADRGIYNSTYKCYVADNDSTVVKPTVSVTVNNTVVDKKYYTVTYENNKGIGNGKAIVTLNDAGKAVFNASKASFEISFKIKMDINKANLKAVTLINNGSTKVDANKPGALTSKITSNGFKAVSISSDIYNTDDTKIAAADLVTISKINGATSTATIDNAANKFIIVYDTDEFFEEEDIFGSAIHTGTITATIKASTSSPYYFGERVVQYYTKFNISNYSNVEMTDYDGNTVKAVNIASSSGKKFLKLNKNYEYTGATITFNDFVLTHNNSNVEDLDSALFKVTYARNKLANNIKQNSTDKDNDTPDTMAQITVSADTAKTSFLFGSKSIYFLINQTNIDDLGITVKGPVDYNGEFQTPDVVIYYNGVKLVKGTDYSLYYSNNKEPGTANVQVTGLNNFNGSVKKTFTINKISVLNKDLSIEWQNDTVSWRFGYQVLPIPIVKYKTQALVRGIDYSVQHLGMFKNGKYTGEGPKLAGEKGYICIVPLATSKYLNADTGTTYNFGSNKSARGMIKEYVISDKINFENFSIAVPSTLVATDSASVADNLQPSLVVNGQVLTAYAPSYVYDLVYAKTDKTKSIAERKRTAESIAPKDNKSIVAYYGYADSKKGFVIIGKVLRVQLITNKSGKLYHDITDKVYLMLGQYGEMSYVCDLHYSTDYNAGGSNFTSGINIATVSYNLNATKIYRNVVMPGVLHVYLDGDKDVNKDLFTFSGATAVANKKKAIAVRLKPTTPELTISNALISKQSPGSVKVTFKASVTDNLEGNTNYYVRFYDSLADAKANTNCVKSYSLKYVESDSGNRTRGLTVRKATSNGVNYCVYDYVVTGLSRGRDYYVNVLAVASNDTKAISNPSVMPKLVTTSIEPATLILAKIYKNASNNKNYDVRVVANLPSHVIETEKDKLKISRILYEVTITNSNGTVLGTYKVSENAYIDNLDGNAKFVKINDTTDTTYTNKYAVTLSSVNGITENSHYFVSLKTYMYYYTGDYASTTYKYECERMAKGTIVKNQTVEAYYTDKASVTVTPAKTTVRSGKTVDVTAKLINTSSKEGRKYVFKILSTDNSVIDTQTYTNVTGGSKKVTLTVPEVTKATYYKIQAIVDSTLSSTAQILVVPTLNNSSYLNRYEINKGEGVTAILTTSGGLANADITYTIYTAYSSKPISSYTNLAYEKLFSMVKENGSTYSINGGVFNKNGYYAIKIMATDTNDTGVAVYKTVTVTDMPANNSTASRISDFMLDGVSINCKTANMTNVSYSAYLYDNTTKKCVSTVTGLKLGDNTVHFEQLKDGTYLPEGNYYVVVKAKGTVKENGVSSTKTVNSPHLSLGKLKYGALVNTSTIDKTAVAKGAKYDKGMITLTPSSKGGEPSCATTYTVKLVDINNKSYDLNGNAINSADSGTKINGEVQIDSAKFTAGYYAIIITATNNKVQAVAEKYADFRTFSSLASTSFYKGSDKYVIKDKTITVTVNTKITIKVTAKSSLTNVCIQYRKVGASNWTTLKTTQSNTVTSGVLKPSKAVTYEIRVTAKDADGISIANIIKMNVVE